MMDGFNSKNRTPINQLPEASDYTSIQARIRTYQASASIPERDHAQLQTPQVTVKLVDFIGDERKGQPEGIAFSFSDYLELVDWTGRAIRDDKIGALFHVHKL